MKCKYWYINDQKHMKVDLLIDDKAGRVDVLVPCGSLLFTLPSQCANCASICSTWYLISCFIYSLSLDTWKFRTLYLFDCIYWLCYCKFDYFFLTEGSIIRVCVGLLCTNIERARARRRLKRSPCISEYTGSNAQRSISLATLSWHHYID